MEELVESYLSQDIWDRLAHDGDSMKSEIRYQISEDKSKKCHNHCHDNKRVRDVSCRVEWKSRRSPKTK